MYCSKCGHLVEDENSYCSHCGSKVKDEKENTNIESTVKNLATTVFKKMNEMVGENSIVEVHLKDVFSEVFKKHNKQEADQLFISGTSITTPNEEEIITTWPKPWLFVRVFGIMLVVYFLLFLLVDHFQNIHAVPGLIMVGSFTVPFTLLIFFWESNAPRNISLVSVIKMFFLGGVASLFLTAFLFEFIAPKELDYIGAIIVGIVEELGKLLAILFFIRNVKNKYILNGLLIGAAIGAGFAAFESSGYAFKFLLKYDVNVMYDIIFIRGFLAGGGHIVWAAITGAALFMVKEDQPLSFNHLTNKKFLQLFAIPVVLHAIWDMPIHIFEDIYFIPLTLTVIAWIFVFLLMNAGLKQLSKSTK